MFFKVNLITFDYVEIYQKFTKFKIKYWNDNKTVKIKKNKFLNKF